ncbi:MAG: Ig-like domain repeat protein [Clostridia bacterium]|nr:Ig-like domain repeat protein [Clostridia bacterium]
MKSKRMLIGLLGAMVLSSAIAPGFALGSGDTAPPESWANISPVYNSNGWNKSDVTVNLYGNDSGSGISRLEYKLGDGTWQTGNQFKLTSEGVYNISYRAVDKAGNVESANSTVVRLDKTVPAVSIPSNLNGAFRNNDSLTIDYTATDALAGTDQVEVKVNEVVVNKGQVIPLTNYALGVHTIKVTATDKAGNRTTQETRFGVTNTQDTVAPTTTATFPNANSNGWHNNSVTVAFSAVDNSGGAGIRNTEYRVNNGNWTTGTNVTISSEGTHTLAYRSVDLAGNVETTKELTFKIDTAKPALDLNIANSYKPGDILTVDFVYSDNVSGVQRVEATLDNVAVSKGQQISLNNYAQGNHFLRVVVTDYAGNQIVKEKVFVIGNQPPANNQTNSTAHLIADIRAFVQADKIPAKIADNNLIKQLEIVQFHLDEGEWEAAKGKLGAYTNYLKAQSGKKIPKDVARHLVNDAELLKKFAELWKKDEERIEKELKEKQKRHHKDDDDDDDDDDYKKHYRDDDDEDEDDDEDDDDEDDDDDDKKKGKGHEKQKGKGHKKHDD